MTIIELTLEEKQFIEIYKEYMKDKSTKNRAKLLDILLDISQKQASQNNSFNNIYCPGNCSELAIILSVERIPIYNILILINSFKKSSLNYDKESCKEINEIVDNNLENFYKLTLLLQKELKNV